MMSDDESRAKTDSGVIIRVALPEDITSIARLWLKFMEYNARFDDSFLVKPRIQSRFAREILDRLSDPNYRIAVAEVDGEIVGYSFSYISRKPYFFRLGKFGFIGDVFVLDKFRRRGIGKMLAEDAHQFFRRLNVKQVELLVATQNVETIKFWEKLGYTKLLEWMYKRSI